MQQQRQEAEPHRLGGGWKSSSCSVEWWNVTQRSLSCCAFWLHWIIASARQNMCGLAHSSIQQMCSPSHNASHIETYRTAEIHNAIHMSFTYACKNLYRYVLHTHTKIVHSFRRARESRRKPPVRTWGWRTETRISPAGGNASFITYKQLNALLYTYIIMWPTHMNTQSHTHTQTKKRWRRRRQKQTGERTRHIPNHFRRGWTHFSHILQNF